VCVRALLMRRGGANWPLRLFLIPYTERVRERWLFKQNKNMRSESLSPSALSAFSPSQFHIMSIHPSIHPSVYLSALHAESSFSHSVLVLHFKCVIVARLFLAPGQCATEKSARCSVRNLNRVKGERAQTISA
jgi:hypothetical protein